MLVDARSRTLRLIEDLSDEQLLGPHLAIVNPLLWEIGHVAWFQEKWVLRHLSGAGSIMVQADDLYDSAGIPHDTRWSLPLPSRSETLKYMQAVLDRVLGRLRQGGPAQELDYFSRLAGFHEDMHGEAFTYTRQTLGYAPPPGTESEHEWEEDRPQLPNSGDAEIPGGELLLGATREAPFVFDNEKWAHKVEVPPFAMARTQVSNAEFLSFVEEKGYNRPEFWSESGWRWRTNVKAEHPVYWERGNDGLWYCRRYNRLVPLAARLPVLHVSWYEAEAYCKWARRRLPTEAEWELAAAGHPDPGGRAIRSEKHLYPWGNSPPDPTRAHLDGRSAGCIPVDALPAGDSAFGCRQMIGNTWEWTASDFEPYPGFSADPYKEYSQPWFGGTHKVLRGGAFATRARLINNTYRNFYTPDRRDVLAGFRTCRL
jgi:iron(II)-dependent oxidoreductase